MTFQKRKCASCGDSHCADDKWCSSYRYTEATMKMTRIQNIRFKEEAPVIA